LASGLDSLDLGVSIAWGPSWDKLTEKLDTEKSRASGTKGIPFGSDSCLILPAGKGENFRWHLRVPEYHLFLGKSSRPQGTTPNAFVSINSRALWELSAERVVELLTARIRELGGNVIAVKPNRCDLASDFVLPCNLTLDFLLRHRVPSHRHHSHHMRGDALETFYQGGPRSKTKLRIYDKGLEIVTGGEKWWFLQVWNVATIERVWRVEYQVRRSILKKFGIHTLDDLKANTAGLWQYLTEKWFSLRLDNNGNTTRCTVHPWWQMVQDCAERFGQFRPLEKFEGEPADSSWYVKHCAGCLASFAAREGIGDFETASVLLAARMESYWKSRDFPRAVLARSIPLGVPGSSGAAGIDKL
jgi:hypothetical protein